MTTLASFLHSLDAGRVVPLATTVGPALTAAVAMDAYDQIAEAQRGAADEESVVVDLRGVSRCSARFVRQAVAPLLARRAGAGARPLVIAADNDEVLEDLDLAFRSARAAVVAVGPHGPRLLGERSAVAHRTAEVIESGPVTAVSLARVLGRTKQAADMSLKQLWQLGLVSRTRRSNGHGREYLYATTALGCAVAERRA